MRSNFLKAISRTAALAGAGLLLTAGVSSAADVHVYLRAQGFTKALPDGAGGMTEMVPMWGFASCDSTFTTCDPMDAPGPQIDLATGDTLTIHLNNALAAPVSIVVPGQPGGGDSVPAPADALARIRVRSFTHEVAPSATGIYTWGVTTPPLRAGTYLYQSGTQPSIQVPMGLYGALVVRPATAAAGCTTAFSAYDTDKSCYDNEALLLISEVDPLQNRRVAEAALALGTPTQTCEPLAAYTPGAAADYPCTVDYNPIYFLANGGAGMTLPAGNPGDNVLLRFLNAGSRSHTPAIVGLEMGLVAEDGNVYPGLTRRQAEVLLPAGKTSDVLVDMPATDVTRALFDRMAAVGSVDSTDPAISTGGMLMAQLQVGLGSPPPPPAVIYAVDDVYAVIEDTPLAAASVLGNDVGLGGATVAVVVGPQNGTLALNPDGTFTYTPNPDFSGADGFTYSATLAGSSYPAQVALNVSFANDAPAATDDGPYVNAIGSTITVAASGVLGNDADPDGDALTAALDAGPANGVVVLNPDGSFTYTPNLGYTGPDSFTYHAEDATAAASASATVSLTINPVANIALNVQGSDGAPVDNYRWVVQEDATYHVDPAAPPLPQEQLSVNFHTSYMRVVAQGCAATAGHEYECNNVPLAAFNLVALDPSRHYYVSVLPNDAGSGSGHSIGGAMIPAPVSPATTFATPVTVIVNNQPIPSAQVSVMVFEDISPTNGVPDPTDPGLGGFEITLEDAAGRYGQAGGTMSQDADGNPLKNYLDCFGAEPPPEGLILTCPDTAANRTAGVVGQALIRNLPPGKYGVIAVAPGGPDLWTQTSTIEGTKVQDTWVMAGEPPHLVEFGVPFFHAFIGFVNPAHTTVPAGGSGSNTITGNITMVHSARPPDFTAYDSGSYDALAHTRPWIGVNANAGTGPNITTVHAEPDGSFTITGIPDGTHQLVIWDDYLDQIIFYQTVILPGGGAVGNIPVNTWFGRHEHNVFLDDGCGPGGAGIAGNGIREACETGLPDQNINLRFRDGTVFQSYPTDTEGFVPFDQVFPFGAWQVAEVDYTRFRPTGVTVTVDGGGDVSAGPYPGLLNPQDGSPRTDTEPAPFLLEGFQSMPGMTSIFEWGKKPYEPGENGGISGIVFYSSTRGEHDPRLTVGDPWEPGIPGVTVRLYREVARADGGKSLALVEEVQTDSWDAAVPAGCPGEPLVNNPFITTLGGDATRCFDGIRNFEQVQPAVFDGGYAFTGISPGKYVVEVVPPPGYELVKEEDVNVGFGDAFATSPALVMIGPMMVAIVPDPATVLAAQAAEPGVAQPPCVGGDHEVPPYLSLFPSVMEPAPFAGAVRPLCNRKEVILSDQSQAAADFHLFTSAPVAGQYQGLVTDDIAIDPDPASPSFGDKWGPAYLPISQRDFLDHEVYRAYSDGFGHYNGMVPSTFSANIPVPSGYSPAVHQVCLNDPGPIPGPTPGTFIFDPLRNPNYGSFCYNLMYMPGTTTYLDTPVLPLAAYAAGFNSVDCAFPDGTPVIAQVNVQGSGDAPWTSNTGGTATIFIHGLGSVQVPNPAYEGPLAPAPYNQPTITRNYGFGSTQGSGTVTADGVTLTINNWNQNLIQATAPACGAPPCTYQLKVTRDNGRSTVHAVTLTESTEIPIRVPADFPTIQAAIDAANAGALILVSPGLYYEPIVMWKPVRLQGAGAGSTFINAIKRPPTKLEAWRQKVKGLIDDGSVDLVPGQPASFDLVGPGLFGTELGGGITVLAKNDPADASGNSFMHHPSRIDGFTITGGDGGGGIFVNGYAHNLVISNNDVTYNSGVRHGGIRVGHPFLPQEGTGPFGYNTHVNIHHNAIRLNGGQSDVGAGGGLSLCTGSDSYTVSRNYICGNFNLSDGAGIAHLGLSDDGLIEFNQILFNQTFNQGLSKSGGGLLIAGEPPVAPATLTLGAGDVAVDGNLIQGNQAGSGHGAGVRTQFVNGSDATGPTPWSLTFTNNMIVNNVAGWSGAGISLQDTTNASIVNNTIANNDTTATVGGLVVANVSTAQPAGISSERYSLALANALGAPGGFSDPMLVNNIVWHNRAFHYDATLGMPHLEPILAQAAVGDCDAAANYWDLGVLGEPLAAPALQLNPTYSVLTDTTGYAGSNISGNPAFLHDYCNGARTLSTPGPMQLASEVVEGGNFIDVRFGPLTQLWSPGPPYGPVNPAGPWNYHIGASSSALNNGNNAGAPNHDFDNEARPQDAFVERGADEVPPAGPGTVTFESATLGTLAGGTLGFGNRTGLVSSTVTLRVGGGTPVAFGTLIVGNTIGTAYSKGADTCSNATVAVGGACTVAINFNAPGGNPSGTLRTGTLTAPHDQPSSPATLSLTGR